MTAQDERIVERLDAMVAAGRITEEEAEAALDRVRAGEHSGALRRQIRGGP